MKLLFQTVLPLNTDNSKYLFLVVCVCDCASQIWQCIIQTFCIEMCQTSPSFEWMYMRGSYWSFKGRPIVACQKHVLCLLHLLKCVCFILPPGDSVTFSKVELVVQNNFPCVIYLQRNNEIATYQVYKCCYILSQPYTSCITMICHNFELNG